MADVRARMKDLDGLTDPDLWTQIQTRSTDEGMRDVAETPSRPSRARRARAAILAAAVFAVAGLFAWQAFHPAGEAVPSTPPTPGVWSVLHRPLRLPEAVVCPSSPVVKITPIGGGFSGGPFPARGGGPVFVVAEPASPVVHLRPSDRTDGGWYELKTIFTADPKYRGPLLIRAAQLAGSGGIRFERTAFNAPLPTELHLTTPADTGGVWVSWPTVTLVRSTGCFAYQIDGTSFTEVIVFEARTP